MSEKEAIQRYIKSEEISETEFELDNNISFETIEFEDEFGTYDIWE